MRYFLKVYGYSRSSINSSNFDEMGKLDSAYYLLHSKIFFGKTLPTNYSIGDVFIQYVPLSQKVNKAGRILGVYQSTSGFKKGRIVDIDVKTGELKEFLTYIEVKNLNLSFSQRSCDEELLTMSKEKSSINFPIGNIASGWAYLNEKDANYLIDKIDSFK